MRPSQQVQIKLDLDKIAKRCGTCQFCRRYEILLWSQDIKRLKSAAEYILNSKGSEVLKSEYVVDLLCVVEKLGSEKVFCGREKTWTHFMEAACSLWLPRPENEPT